jgi:hypothetical protein
VSCEQNPVVVDLGAISEQLQSGRPLVNLASVPMGAVVSVCARAPEGEEYVHFAFRRCAVDGEAAVGWTLVHDQDSVVIEEPVVIDGSLVSSWGVAAQAEDPTIREDRCLGYMTYAPLTFRHSREVPHSEYGEANIEPPELLSPEVLATCVRQGWVIRQADGLLYWQAKGHKHHQATGPVLWATVEYPAGA